jgi:hypothetical protein
MTSPAIENPLLRGVEQNGKHHPKTTDDRGDRRSQLQLPVAAELAAITSVKRLLTAEASSCRFERWRAAFGRKSVSGFAC